MGVATGCGCKEVYRFPHTTYPYSSCTYLFFFTAASLLFVHLKKKFFVLLINGNVQYARLYREICKYLVNVQHLRSSFTAFPHIRSCTMKKA